jgi:hypothetical protein
MLAVASVMAAAVIGGATPGFAPSAVDAASCVRFSGSNWDAPGDDNYMPQLNEEWVRIRNSCATAQSIGGWKIHDLNQNHVYRFASGVTIGAGKTITLHSGRGTNSAAHRYWGYSYGAVWNNSGPERATLKNSAGTVLSTWVE